MKKQTIEAICYGIIAALIAFSFWHLSFWIWSDTSSDDWAVKLQVATYVDSFAALVFGCYVTAKLMEE